MAAPVQHNRKHTMLAGCALTFLVGVLLANTGFGNFFWALGMSLCALAAFRGIRILGGGEDAAGLLILIPCFFMTVYSVGWAIILLFVLYVLYVLWCLIDASFIYPPECD